MTAAAFRKLALSFPGAVELSHVGHPDFRAGEKGRIFATVGHPDDDSAVLILEPEQQQELIGRYPEMLEPVSGGWGRRGSTRVLLRAASPEVVKAAMEIAWAKATAKRPKRKPQL